MTGEVLLGLGFIALIIYGFINSRLHAAEKRQHLTSNPGEVPSISTLEESPSSAMSASATEAQEKGTDTTVVKVLSAVAWLELVGGFICMLAFWPDSAPIGYELKAVAYVVPVAWLVAGVVFWALFMGAAEGLRYLARIDAKLSGKHLIQ